jgi:diguanylate cyclase (GGDEF)-like protein
MMKSAVIVAKAAEERRSIAQQIKPTELFSRIHFCSNAQDVRFLFKNTAVDILLCDVETSGHEALRSTAELANLASEHMAQMIFFSHHDPVELPLLGVIPPGSHCLSYDSSPAITTDLLSRLLNREPATSYLARTTPEEKLIDKNSGIYNRFYFDAFLDQELSRTKLTGRPFSLLLIEPSELEQQEKNAGWGAVLPSIALAIKNQIRTSDLLCRIEIKRLALLLPETTNLNARHVRQRIQHKSRELAQEFPFDLKIGLASPDPANNLNRQGLLREAEATL